MKMVDSPELSVVIPFYKCELTVGDLISRISALHAQIGKIEIVVVDDASPDVGASLTDSLAQKNADLRYFRLPRNRGQHYATLFGVKQTTGRNIAIIDCDLENSPEDIPALLEGLSTLDCVVAESPARSRNSSLRRVLRRVYAQFLSRALGFNVSKTGLSSFSFCVLGPRSVAVARDLKLSTIPLSISLLRSDLRIGSRTVKVAINTARKSSYRVAENIDIALRTLLFSGKFLRLILIRLLLAQFVLLGVVTGLILYQFFRFGSSDGWYSFLLAVAILSTLNVISLVALLIFGSIQVEDSLSR